jgi:hypothetical protein
MNEEMTKEEIIGLQSEMNVFDRLLTFKDKLLDISVDVPFMDEPLKIYYMVLKKEDEPDIDMPSDIMDWQPNERFKFLLKQSEARVWAMIKKANKHKDVPKKYKFSQKNWDAIKKTFPDITEMIVGRITGSLDKMLENFIIGRPTQK